MIDIETMVKALRLAWIPRLLKIGSLNWKTVPDYYFKKYGGLGFLLKCNYRVEDFKDIPRFCNLNLSTTIEMIIKQSCLTIRKYL